MTLFRFASIPPNQVPDDASSVSGRSSPEWSDPSGDAADFVAVNLDGTEVAIAPKEARLALALLDGEVGLTMRSAKYRRPRTGYCLSGDCGSCLVRIDGLPNRRACMTPVQAGSAVERQNTLRPPALDPTRLVDAMLWRGMDHHHFVVRPWLANQLMQGVARHLAGIGEIPATNAPATHVDFETQQVDVLVIGAGLAGLGVASALHAASISHLVVDRHDEAWIATHAFGEGRALLAGLGAVRSTVLTRTSVFGLYPEEGLVAAVRATSHTDRPRSGGDESHSQAWPAVNEERLLIVRPRHVVFAMGSRDPILPFADNDRPGVVAARGLLRQLAVADATLDAPVVVVGDGDHARACAQALGAGVIAIVPSEDAVGVRGSTAVRGLRTRQANHACRLVAVAAPPAPASDLAAMTDVCVRFDGAGFALEVDEHGRCRTRPRAEYDAPLPWTAWAAGDVTGYRLPAAAHSDGVRVGEHVAAAIRASCPLAGVETSAPSGVLTSTHEVPP